MVIRTAGDADLSRVCACLASAFEPYRDLYTPGAFADTVLTVETARRRLERMTILVADDRGSIVGTIGYHAGADGEGHLRGMAVEHSAQGSGLAAGCTRVMLDTTRPLERAIAFYRRHGYTPTGVIGDFHGMEVIEYE
jgi:GNAT superfamily N-acetyltransferase